MFKFLKPFPIDYHDYKLHDYHDTSCHCTKWSSVIIGSYVSYTCRGEHGYYVFLVRDDNTIISITYYSDRTGKIEIDSRSVQYSSH